MTITQTTLPDRTLVKVGDSVGFKSDIEQYGEIVEIKTGDRYRGPALVLRSVHGFQGEYISGKYRTVQDARDCWA